MSEPIPTRSTDREREHSSARRSGTDEATFDSQRPMSPSEIQAAYAEYADTFHRFSVVDRAITGRYRRRQFGDAEGRVLDVACGTGTNFRYLPESVDLVAVDLSPEMLSKARETLADLPVDGDLQRMDAASLSFEDDSFDTVLSALSTCTFPDPVAALREMERVCKPGGRILLVEHGLSDFGPLATYQQWREDAHYAKAGCRWTQEPLSVVEAAGLQVETARTGLLGMVTCIECRPRRVTSDSDR
jgi:ubiquinone/menaquinone biosynthesis C-methylase UbiE